MSEFKLADTMQTPTATAKAVIDKFFGVVPKVKDFLNTCGSFGRKKGYIRTHLIFNREGNKKY